ncbi:MAG TPA: metallophosphoesterase [Anaerolineales bacterium]|nr:metallophosphoesterase [Anaerolineales bacterium]
MGAPSMIILAVTDVHGDFAAIPRIAADLEAADVVILSGDLTNFGRRRDAERVLQAITRYARRVLAVPGNCDYPEVSAYLDELGINLHGTNKVIKDIGLFGVGGSLPAPGSTPFEFSEDELRNLLTTAAEDLPKDTPTILVSHQPPFGTKNDEVFAGDHVGSKAVRSFIEARQPILCLTGHIHEAAGIDSIDGTRIVNPGPFSRGGYTYAVVREGLEQLEIRDWKAQQ